VTHTILFGFSRRSPPYRSTAAPAIPRLDAVRERRGLGPAQSAAEERSRRFSARYTRGSFLRRPPVARRSDRRRRMRDAIDDMMFAEGLHPARRRAHYSERWPRPGGRAPSTMPCRRWRRGFRRQPPVIRRRDCRRADGDARGAEGAPASSGPDSGASKADDRARALRFRTAGTLSSMRVAPAPVPLHDAPPAISWLDGAHHERGCLRGVENRQT
jgi:hypothetical protein